MTELSAGLELDCLIGEKVMGWHDGGDLHWWSGREQVDAIRGWSPSMRIEHAWEVVEKLKHGGIGFSIQFTALGWLCWFRSALDQVARADTAPHAICLAALTAMKITP